MRYYDVRKKLGSDGIGAWRRMTIYDADGIGEIDPEGFFYSDADAKNSLVEKIKTEMQDD